MILIYLFAAAAAIIAYFHITQLGMSARIGIALLIFGLPSVLVTLWMIMIGDKAPPDAVTVKQENVDHEPSVAPLR